MPRRSSVESEPVAGEGYLGSVSDLMAALIFVFILTVAVFALRLAQAEQTVQEILSTVTETRAEMLEEIKERLSSLGIDVLVVPEQGVLRIRENGIYFDSGAAWPVGKNARNVGKIAHVLAEVLPCYVAERRSNQAIGANATRPAYCDESALELLPCDVPDEARLETALIEGHTDPKPIRGGFRDNLDLSSARAGQVFRMMTECEPSLETLLNSNNLRILGVSGYAERRRVSPVDAENRRIDLRFMMELPNLDGAIHGKAGVDEVLDDVSTGVEAR